MLTALAVGKAVKKIPRGVWLTLGIILILACSHLAVYFHGKSVVQTKWDASVERGRELVKGLTKTQKVIEYQVVTRYVDRVKTIREKGETIEKLIPVYIPADTPPLPSGFRVLHDAAATNTIPESPTGVGAKPVSVEDVATTVNANYQLCHVERQKLSSLWDLWQTNRKAYLDLCKQQGLTCK